MSSILCKDVSISGEMRDIAGRRVTELIKACDERKDIECKTSKCAGIP